MTVTEAYAVLTVAHYMEQDEQACDADARRALTFLLDAAGDRLNIAAELAVWPAVGPAPLIAGPIR